MFQGLKNWVGGLLSAVGGFFKHVADFLMKHILRHIIAVLTAAYEILDNLVGVFVKIINRIRKWYYDHVYKIQKAILNVISVARVFLSLLRLMNVKWATKLDRELQKIQAYVTDSILYVVGTLNALSSYMTLIVDPGMVLRSDFMLASLVSGLGFVKRVAGFGSNAPLSATDQAAQQDSLRDTYGPVPLATIDRNGVLSADQAYQSVLEQSDASTADYLQRLQ